jgi:hypothetical protein
MAENRLITRIWKNPRVSTARHFISPTRWYRYSTASHRRLPDFIIAGAQKAGTSSLHNVLGEHPEVISSITKEVHYFDQYYHLGEQWYRSCFPLATASNARKLCGEATPMYMFSPHAPQRIAKLLPQVKIIVLLRNPINRAYSHYHQIKQLHREPLSFEDALTAEPSRTAAERARMITDAGFPAWNYRWYSYAERGIYVDQILELRKHFPRENILIMQSEKYFSDTRGALNRIVEFLGLDSWQWPEFPKRAVKNREKMLPETRERLRAYVAPHNARLFAELGETYDWD